MIKIKGKFLSFEKLNGDGSIIFKDCKINYPEKVPIVWDFNPIGLNLLGTAKVIREEDGLYFDGELADQDITKVIQKESANLGVGGFYNRLKRNDHNKIIGMNLCYISITPTPVSPDYTFEVIESEE